MREQTKESPIDRGEVELAGRCQVCGEVGRVIAVPGALRRTSLPRCAIEYGAEAAVDDAGP